MEEIDTSDNIKVKAFFDEIVEWSSLLVNSLSDEKSKLYIYKIQNKIISYILTYNRIDYKNKSSIVIQALEIKKEYRNRGIGKLLLSKVLSEGKETDSKIELYAPIWIKQVGQFYINHDFYPSYEMDPKNHKKIKRIKRTMKNMNDHQWNIWCEQNQIGGSIVNE
jgi:ribosomal protein S18 acetylase RimI-like enzyme